MKTIVKRYSEWRRRRLRERCVKYAVKVYQSNGYWNVCELAIDFYRYITKGTLVD